MEMIKETMIKMTNFRINESLCKNPSLFNKSSLKNLLYPQHSPISKSDVNSLKTFLETSLVFS